MSRFNNMKADFAAVPANFGAAPAKPAESLAKPQQVAEWVQNPGGSQHTWQGADPMNGGRTVNGQAVGTGAVNVYGDPNKFSSGSGLYPKLLKPGM